MKKKKVYNPTPFWAEWESINSKPNNMQSTSSNWLAIVLAVIAGVTPFVVGEQLQQWFGLSDSGINIVRGIFALLGVVVTAYNGVQIQKKSA